MKMSFESHCLGTSWAMCGKSVLLLLIAFLGPPGCQKATETAQHPESAVTQSGGPTVTVAGMPRLVDLGADKCIPCKMMAPILEELREEYAGSLEVVFIDVWLNPDAGQKYGIEMIPTQIFYDAAGKELFRHEGFFGEEEILAKWKELGIQLPPKQSAQSVETS